MTELQVTINNLKETIIAADLLLQKLEKVQKDSEKSKTPNFPSCFCVVRDENFPTEQFLIGLQQPITWDELPGHYVGRAGYGKDELRQIINGLQILIGD